MLSPAPAERMAVLLTRLLPGSAARMDCAVSLGSFWGTPGPSARVAGVVWKALALARGRRRVVGRVRMAPGAQG